MMYSFKFGNSVNTFNSLNISDNFNIQSINTQVIKEDGDDDNAENDDSFNNNNNNSNFSNNENIHQSENR